MSSPASKRPRTSNKPSEPTSGALVAASGAPAIVVTQLLAAAPVVATDPCRVAPKVATEPSALAPAPPWPVSITTLLEMDARSGQGHAAYLTKWAAQMKLYVDTTLISFLAKRQANISFTVPTSPLLIPPLQISDAASGAKLTAFREVMNYENLKRSFSQSAQYEAAGTVWMLDPVQDSSSDVMTITQLESAMWTWSQEAFILSSPHEASRRFSFDVPLPAKVEDQNVAQRLSESNPGVLMANAVPMLAGRAIVIAWYGAMGEALQAGKEDVVFRLFEAALSVPIRLRLCPDEDTCHVVSLLFAENLFASSAASGAESFWKFAEKVGMLSGVKRAVADNVSLPKMCAAIRAYGLTFKGKALTEGNVKAFKSLVPFVGNEACAQAYSLMECVCPELRESTLLMRVAQLSSAKASSNSSDKQDESACHSLAFVFDCLRVYRLTGNCPKEDVYTVSKISGQEKKTPALVHLIFKKKDIIDYVLHEVELLDASLLFEVEKFRTPLDFMTNFSASGERGLVDAFRKGNLSAGEDFECRFAVPVAEFRDACSDGRTQALVDFMWQVWCGTFDDDIRELCNEDMQKASTSFLWHRFFKESRGPMAVTYRKFVDACSTGPIASGSTGQILMGTSELCEEEKNDLQSVQDMLMKLRRKTVSFLALGSHGGASGPEFSKVQLEKAYEGMRLGHKFKSKKGEVRAFVLSAELFPPNVQKHGMQTTFSAAISCDQERMKRVIEFIVQRRTRDDIVLLFDGRSKSCRRVMEDAEERLAASGAHSPTECWFVYLLPTKTQDPRIPARQTSFLHCNREVGIFSLAAKRGPQQIIHRAEFNSCGENSTSSTTYTGVPIRRFCELPRMDVDTKAAVLGTAVTTDLKGKRVLRDIDEKGHPYSHCEAKPINLWQRICEHHQVTHIVDFSPGSGALALAASGAMEYEGICANDVHRDWLDSTLDRCIMYMVGQDKALVPKIGGDQELMDKAHKYFAGTMMDARRLMEPVEPTGAAEVDSESDEE